MNEKIVLSVIIPAYNVEKYILKCLKSLISVINNIEIIIVNDGSVDQTLAIAKSFQKEHKENVKIIDQQNGGHGSTINTAIKEATGKYLRILDSDDWLNEKEIIKYVEELKNSREDLILTNYTYQYVTENNKEFINIYGKTKNLKSISDFAKMNISDHEFITLLTIHSCTIKTAKLKEVWGGGLIEKTFYEDQEFVAKMILASDTVKLLNLDIYQYMIGRDEQSMSAKKLFNHRKDHAKVLARLSDIYKNCDNNFKKDIILRRIKEMFKTHYWIYFYHNGLSHEDRKDFKRLVKQLKAKIPDITKNITLDFKIRLAIGRLKNTMLK